MEKSTIKKTNLGDLKDIEEILLEWIEKKEADKHIARIKNEIQGEIESNMKFWVARKEKKVVGIIGLSDPLPKVLIFSKTIRPAEIKILYVKKDFLKEGVGDNLISFIENEARRQGYLELIVKSSEKQKKTAADFYKIMGYKKVGVLTERDDMAVFRKKLFFKKILLDGVKFNFSEFFLPCLISGKAGRGASQFTASVAASLLEKKEEMVFFCGYPDARDNLLSQIPKKRLKGLIVACGDVGKFKEILKKISDDKKIIVFVKNFEKLSSDTLKLFIGREKLILSGNVDECVFQEEIIEKEFKSKIFFSKPVADFKIKMSDPEKYKAFYCCEKEKGIIRLV